MGPRIAMAAIHKAALSDADIQAVYDNLATYFSGKLTLA